MSSHWLVDRPHSRVRRKGSDAHTDMLRVGDWHNHPSHEPEPSPKDMSAWQTHRRGAGVSHYVSLIATPHSEMGWMAPELHGYVTREDEDGVLVCDAAAVWEP